MIISADNVVWLKVRRRKGCVLYPTHCTLGAATSQGSTQSRSHQPVYRSNLFNLFFLSRIQENKPSDGKSRWLSEGNKLPQVWT